MEKPKRWWRGWGVAAALAAAGMPLLAAEPGETVIRLSAAPGLKFDPPRFQVAPGATVRVTFHNPDEMIHNFVITEPGARMEVVTASLAMGADGAARNFVPDSKRVLWSTRALNPNETVNLTFTAPLQEGVYPYVCTFPGHGFVMYGAMYVTTNGTLPALDRDPNLPPRAAAVFDLSDHSLGIADRPLVSRTFLPDCGPAAIAIGLPGGQSYCFDAGLCRMRYAWKGGFVDNGAQWLGKGDLWAKVVGRIYYRAPNGAPLRIGERERQPQVRWRGYRLVGGYPQLHYFLDGAEVREIARAKSDGIEFTYEIQSGLPVYFVSDPEGGAAFTSSAGTWAGGILTLQPAEAKRFTLTMTERPKVEPLGYWSMNDTFTSGRKDPPPGVVGRAYRVGGLNRKRETLDTGIGSGALKAGATLLGWVKLDAADEQKKGAAGVQPLFSAGQGDDKMVIAAPVSDADWHYVAVTLEPGGSAQSVDGGSFQPVGAKLPAAEANLFIGSISNVTFMKGLVDEVRIYDRILTLDEIRKIYLREKPAAVATSQ